MQSNFTKISATLTQNRSFNRAQTCTVRFGAEDYSMHEFSLKYETQGVLTLTIFFSATPQIRRSLQACRLWNSSDVTATPQKHHGLQRPSDHPDVLVVILVFFRLRWADPLGPLEFLKRQRKVVSKTAHPRLKHG